MYEFRFPTKKPDPASYEQDHTALENYLIDGITNGGGELMVWQGEYESGRCYFEGDVVTDGAWLMVANKDSCDRPAPQPDGDPLWTMADVPSWTTTQDTVTFLGTATRLIFNRSGWVSAWRVWIPVVSVDYRYVVSIFDQTDPAHVIENQLEITPVAVGWYEVNVSDRLITAGSDFVLVLYAQNQDGSITRTYDWGYSGPSQLTQPASGDFNNNNQSDLLRIHVLDDSGANLAALLSLIQPGDQLDIDDGSWVVQVQLSTRIGDVYEMNVSTITGASSQLVAGSVYSISWEEIAAQPTSYVNILSGWAGNQPSFAAASGIYTDEPLSGGDTRKFDLSGSLRRGAGISQLAAVESSTQYGVDLEFTPAIISEDWDLLGYSPIGGSEGDGGGGIAESPLGKILQTVDYTADNVASSTVIQSLIIANPGVVGGCTVRIEALGVSGFSGIAEDSTVDLVGSTGGTGVRIHSLAAKWATHTCEGTWTFADETSPDKLIQITSSAGGLAYYRGRVKVWVDYV